MTGGEPPFLLVLTFVASHYCGGKFADSYRELYFNLIDESAMPPL